MAKDFDIIKTALATTIFVILGWLGFEGFLDLFPFLRTMHPLFKIGTMIIGFWLAYKFGWKRD